jgi:hypothetical protein
MTCEVKVVISINGSKETAQLICDSKTVSITFVMNNGFKKTYMDTNFYRCFGKVREDNPNINFLCKGSKINVHPSSMSSQMSLGLKSYELTMGKKASDDDLIYIFDFEESNLTNDPADQRNFYMQWIESEKD